VRGIWKELASWKVEAEVVVAPHLVARQLLALAVVLSVYWLFHDLHVALAAIVHVEHRLRLQFRPYQCLLVVEEEVLVKK